MLKTKLSQAIAFAMTGIAITAVSSSDAAAATVSYNAFNHDRSAPNALVSGGNGTDGWMRTGTNACGTAGSTCGNGPTTSNNPTKITSGGAGNAAVPWVGNDARTDANFNYSGTQTLNWTAVIGAGETAVVSRLDSNTRYGGTVLSDGTTFNYADIDTAKGAWHDGASDGWKHDTDIGLFKSNVTQTVTLSISSLLGNGSLNETPDYGFTVFEGKNTGTTNYSHHGAWHSIDPASAQALGNNATQITDPNPFGGSGLTALILDDVVGNSATFTAEAGKIYTIMLGGFQAGDWIETRNDYQLTIAAVPVPGAVWLFGSALTGFIGLQRRKRALA
ncbi:hypothetical protein RO575_17325 [Methylomonas sp. MO1]|uniref:hypothetical protein n=1 Tax=Methylomonas sp. MO1 TaxID=3073619 RepID=UPI0028A53B77|nr:hypothetical protein [Methylomonas sp. MO1]MDT4291329.1 hypothetical protein [Methylomonas sp. MO1]